MSNLLKPVGIFETQKSKKRTLTSADKRRIAAKQNYKCKKCRSLMKVWHIDHIKQFSRGGSDKESNLQALCGTCHAEKTEGDRHKNKQRRKNKSSNALDFCIKPIKFKF